MIRHYYHCYADAPYWTDPVTEHLAALAAITEPVELTVGLVGSQDNRDLVIEHVAPRLPACVAELRYATFNTGWEQPTLELLHAAAAKHEDPILYCHTKGSVQPAAEWRKRMTANVVGRWEECLLLLGKGAQAVGSHWLTPAEWPERVDSPYFGGNFWWARADYVRTLPPLRYDKRHEAEAWIGRGDPRVVDLAPGWPY